MKREMQLDDGDPRRCPRAVGGVAGAAVLLALTLLLGITPWAHAQDPVISEVMAANSGPVADENGDTSDWIEIFNPADTAVDLGGWYLTDSPANLPRWRMPSVVMDARTFLLVFASAKNRTNTAIRLHTDFKLNASGDYLALVKPDGVTIAHHYSPRFPPQTGGLSYGLAMVGLELVTTNTFGYLTPSPREGNGAFLGFGPALTNATHDPPQPNAGEPIRVRVRVPPSSLGTEAVTLRYRVMFEPEVSVEMADDGEHGDDRAGDGIYGAAISTGSAKPGEMLRWMFLARDASNQVSRLPAFRDRTGSAEYFGTVVRDPLRSTPLPVFELFITPANLSLANSSVSARAACSIFFQEAFYDNVGINLHGTAAAGFPKRSYDLAFNREHPARWTALGSPVKGLLLMTTYADKTHLRNVLASRYTYRPAGAPHFEVEPVRVQTNGGFYGIWQLMENDDEEFLRRQGRDGDGALYRMGNAFTSPFHATTASTTVEKKTRQAEGSADLQALFSGVVAPLSVSERARSVYDQLNVAEILNSLAARAVTGNWDCCHENYYLYRDTEGTGEWESIPWDVDLSFGRNWSSTQSYWDDAVYPQNRIWGNWDVNGLFQVLLNMPAGRGVDATRQMYLRRVRTLMDRLQAAPHYEQAVDEWGPRLAPDAALDLAKWGSWGGGQINIFNTNSPAYRSLPAAIAELKTNYLVNRRRFVFEQKMNLPAEFPERQPDQVSIRIGAIEFNPVSGNQDEEYIELINTNDFAVDISGWRLSGAVDFTFQGGVVIPSGPPPTNTLYVVKDKRAFRARAAGPRGGQGLYLEGGYRGQLSARGETVVLTSPNPLTPQVTNSYPGQPTPAQRFLRVTEIHHHPGSGRGDDQYPRRSFAFVELQNLSSESLDLSRVRVEGSIRFDFTNSVRRSLGPQERLVLVENSPAFGARYGTGVAVAGQYDGSLSVPQGTLRVLEAGENVLDARWEIGWYPITDGAGFALVIRNPTGPWEAWETQAGWRPGSTEQGSPGQPDVVELPAVPVVWVNEVLSNPVAPFEDYIELFNPSPSAEADVSHWYLTDDPAHPKKFRLPAGLVIPPLGYLAFDEHAFNPPEGSLASDRFGLGADGDAIFLFSGDAPGNLTGYQHGFEFGGAATNTSFGLHVDSTGRSHFVAQRELTPGAPNAGATVGPVVLSEIHYQPQTGSDAGDAADEFIEIANVTAEPVALYDPLNPDNTWRLRGGVNFDCPTGIVLPPGGLAVLVSFAPDDRAAQLFRDRFRVPPEVPLLGPYVGRLSDDGESLRLLRPGAPLEGSVPHILVDGVAYEPKRPWPTTGAFGGSIQRLNLNSFGNEPANWIGAGPTAGVYRPTEGAAPTFIRQPSPRIVGIVGDTLELTMEVSGSEPVLYRWRHDGQMVAGAHGPTLTISPLVFAAVGTYECHVLNSFGAASSQPVVVSAVFPPQIDEHPADVLVFVPPDPRAAPTTNATFRIVGSTFNPPLRYQWRFNGGEVPNATNDTLVVPQVTLASEGEYTCVVSDQYAEALSKPGRLHRLIGPRFIAMPGPLRVVTGATVRVSAAVTGYPLPMTFEWRLGSNPQATHIVEGHEDFWSFIASTNPGTSLYRVVVKNLANPTPGIASPTFSVVTLIDSDADGLPDEFELARGMDPGDPSDAAADLDGDGMSNADEYQAGTDPNDAQSLLRFEPPERTLGDLGAVLYFQALSNRTYAVEARDSLSPGPWRTISQVVGRNTNHLAVVEDEDARTNRVNQRVYRLVTPR